MTGTNGKTTCTRWLARIFALVREQPDYLRGRAPGEVPAILRRAFVELGVPETSLEHADDERAAVALARRWARPGDTIVVFAHTAREPLW